MVIVSPLALQTESGEELRLQWVPQFERLDDAFEIQPGIEIPPGDYRYTAWIAEIDTAPRRRWVASLEARWGSFYDGDLTRLEGDLVLKPSAHVLVGLGGEWSRGTLRAGRFTAKVLAGRLELNFSPNLGWASLAQYDSDSRELGSRVACAFGFGRAATSSSCSTGAGCTKRTASTAPTSTAARRRSNIRSGSEGGYAAPLRLPRRYAEVNSAPRRTRCSLHTSYPGCRLPGLTRLRDRLASKQRG